MNKIALIITCLLCFSFYSNAAVLSDGLYYSYWNYKSDGKIKEYSVLKNKPEKLNGKLILSKQGGYGNDEIYIDIQKGMPTIYYAHTIDEGQGIVHGWADAKFIDNEIVISENTIIAIPEKEDAGNIRDDFIGSKFPGKKIPLKINEIVPFEKIDDTSFKVDCNKYLDVNGYRDGDIPDYSESISGDESIRQSFGGTVFINGEQMCALFMDDDIVREIKKGWISFKKIN